MDDDLPLFVVLLLLVLGPALLLLELPLLLDEAADDDDARLFMFNGAIDMPSSALLLLLERLKWE